MVTTVWRGGATSDTPVAYADFSIESLPPGGVGMRAIVSVDGKAVGRAVRTLRKIR